MQKSCGAISCHTRQGGDTSNGAVAGDDLAWRKSAGGEPPALQRPMSRTQHSPYRPCHQTERHIQPGLHCDTRGRDVEVKSGDIVTAEEDQNDTNRTPQKLRVDIGKELPAHECSGNDAESEEPHDTPVHPFAQHPDTHDVPAERDQRRQKHCILAPCHKHQYRQQQQPPSESGNRIEHTRDQSGEEYFEKIEHTLLYRPDRCLTLP